MLITRLDRGVSDDLEIIHDRNDEFTDKSWKMEGLDTLVFVLHACDKQYCRKADTIYNSSEPGNSGSTGCRTDDIASYVVRNVGTKWD
ncbi:hypothetical protein N7492_009772 [Penicillium capsulatum]|uniref:Uncharacterized protein n=1 Tax=Penicillium capsulatum TaxID=69766 RepID=A0A9W9HN29_9EURO|nr:hypothetical protein N7492_009772 [Penicillium capsulatum]KAJ6114146.1 hypothetical protein N7512_007591 [Penicillium capsulatum]